MKPRAADSKVPRTLRGSVPFIVERNRPLVTQTLRSLGDHRTGPALAAPVDLGRELD